MFVRRSRPTIPSRADQGCVFRAIARRALGRVAKTGGREFGAGCFMGIRNPASHEHDLDLPEPLALEQLAAFSLLARWIEECGVEVDDRL